MIGCLPDNREVTCQLLQPVVAVTWHYTGRVSSSSGVQEGVVVVVGVGDLVGAGDVVVGGTCTSPPGGERGRC